MGHRLRNDTNPGVRHYYFHMRIDPLEPKLNPAPLWCELYGVGKQVPNDLLEPPGISRNRPGLGIEDGFQTDALGLGGRAHSIGGCVHDRWQVDRLNIEPQAPADHSRHVEQVVDELALGFGVAVDAAQSSSCCFGAEAASH